jgi:translation initiation factor 5A
LSKPVDLGSVKIGSYLVIDGEPCRVVEYEKSKPGKHGAAKARVVAIGVFDGTKKSIVSPVDAKVDVPIIEKRSGQIISIGESEIQIMDLESYEVFDSKMPEEEEIRVKLASGIEVEYWKVLGRVKVVRIKSQ